MTNIPITGKIVSVEVVDDAPYGYAEYSCDPEPASPTIIEPTGNRVSTIALSFNGVSGVPAGFKINDDFEIGDVIEFFKKDAAYTNNFSILTHDNHSLAVTSSSNQVAVIVKKLYDGTAKDWLTYD